MAGTSHHPEGRGEMNMKENAQVGEQQKLAIRNLNLVESAGEHLESLQWRQVAFSLHFHQA